MAKACEELILCRVGCTPPAVILIRLIIFLGAHDIEGRDAHQPIRQDCSRVGRPIVCRPDEGIDFVDKTLLGLRL